jgi:chromosome segregation ATPase
MFLENHVEGVAFQPDEPDSAVEVRVDASKTAPDDSHFFVAVCAHRTQLGNPTFVYVPAAANLLRERERHIALLERELAAKNEWLAESEREREKLQDALLVQAAELERSNRWAVDLNRELTERGANIIQLQAELERSNRWAENLNRQVSEQSANISQLQADLERSNRWAENLNREVEERRADITRLQEELERANRWASGLNIEVEGRRARVVELQAEVVREQGSALAVSQGYQAKVAGLEEELARRAAWANGLQDQVRKLEEHLATVRSAAWVKLGKKTGMGPAV